jgi:hypothetical protein
MVVVVNLQLNNQNVMFDLFVDQYQGLKISVNFVPKDAEVIN